MVEEYELICKIGEGTFGEVYKAKRVRDGVSVALKKLRIRRAQHGLPQIVLREIKALQHIRHRNVVRLWDYFATGSVVVIACEYMAADLHEMMSNMRRPFAEAEVKSLMRMLLEGVAGIHACNIIHRDLKPSNLLLSPSGVLKIGDFGLARVNSGPGATFSHQVATRWYRAPELLYGARNYGSAVDLWSVGCIFAELLNHSPFVAGENDIDQLYRVLRVMGTPTDASWPEAKSLPDFNKIQFSRMEAIPLEQLVPDASADAVSLLGSLLAYREKERISAEEALLHPFFFSEPLPSTPADLVRHIPLQSRSSQPSFDVNAAFSLPLELPLEARVPAAASGEA